MPDLDIALVIQQANRFEAIAADGFDGKPYRAALEAQAAALKAMEPVELAPRVAHALGVMIDMIKESDPANRFARKTAILREAVELLKDGSPGAYEPSARP
jgi:hypothetical protein